MALEHVRDVKFWAGMKLDPQRVLGSMIVRTDRDIDVMEYNPYDLEHVSLEESQPSPREWQYVVEFVLRDDDDRTTTDLLFRSGCLFEPPALVRGEFELQTILAPGPQDVQRLIHLLEDGHRDYRVLSVREAEPNQKMSSPVMWSGTLTPRQLRAIRIAFREGFYRYPRKIRISDLARMAGSARSTFQEHLRLAEIKLIRSLLQTEGPRDQEGSSESRSREDRRRRMNDEEPLGDADTVE